VANRLKEIKTFLLDMDGTIYLGDSLIDGSLDLFEAFEKKGIKRVFLTNNSGKNAKDYVAKLSKLGIEASENEILTSGEACAIYLQKEKEGASIYLVSTPSLETTFKEMGFCVNEKFDTTPDYVVLGFDTTLTYEKIHKACDYIKAGAKFIATHPDLVCPLKDGASMPDTGAMIKMFEAATGISPLIIGKPNQPIIDAVIHKFGLKKEETAMVGDRIYTDVQMAVNAGITSVLVLSGETTQKIVDESSINPDFVLSSVKDIYDTIK